MEKIVNELMAMPFTKNQYGKASHEDAIEQIFIQNNLVLNPMKISKSERDAALKGADIEGLKNSQYLAQPCGNNDSPDFIVKHNNKLYFFEAKSSSQPHPTFNGGLPKEQYIYVFSTKKYNETTIFLGKDAVNDIKRDLFGDLVDELRDVVKKYQSMDAWQDDDRGFDFYMRSMFIQSGGASKTDYFKHSDREQTEKNVLEWVR